MNDVSSGSLLSLFLPPPTSKIGSLHIPRLGKRGEEEAGYELCEKPASHTKMKTKHKIMIKKVFMVSFSIAISLRLRDYFGVKDFLMQLI